MNDQKVDGIPATEAALLLATIIKSGTSPKAPSNSRPRSRSNDDAAGRNSFGNRYRRDMASEHLQIQKGAAQGGDQDHQPLFALHRVCACP